MKIGKVFTSLTLATIFVVTTITGCQSTVGTSSSGTSSEGLTTVHVAVMTGTFTQYTAVIGKEQGIFEKYGIDLDITEYAAGVNTIDAVTAGQSDIGMMADYAVVNRIGNTLDSTNLEVISEIQGGPVTNGGLYVAPEYVNNLSALDGKGFFNMVGTVQEYYNSKIFSFLNFDEKKQNLQNADSYSTGLALAQSGDSSAAFASGANVAYYKALGWKEAKTAEELGISTYSYYLTTKSYNANNTQTVANFLTATQESYDYIINHLDESATYLETKLGIDGDNFKNDWSVASSRIGFSNEGLDQLNEIESWAYQNGRFSKEFDISDFINTDALEIAFPDRVELTN